MPAGRLYLDAYGEPGRAMTSQAVYVVCVIWLPGNDASVEALLTEVRKELGLKPDYEFHARKLTKQRRREKLPKRLFEALLAHNLQFQGWCAVMHKSKSRLPLEVAGQPLFHELVTQAIARMPEEFISGVTLTFDEQQTSKKPGKSAQSLRKHLNDALQRDGRAYQLGRVIAKPAHQCGGLQLADYVAAAVADPWPECLALFTANQIHTWRT